MNIGHVITLALALTFWIGYTVYKDGQSTVKLSEEPAATIQLCNFLDHTQWYTKNVYWDLMTDQYYSGTDRAEFIRDFSATDSDLILRFSAWGCY